MSVYKRMKLACCFDCGRSERDCSCMSGSVHSNMDSLQRAFPLSSVSVHDCSTSLRACKFDRQITCRSMSVTCERACVCVSVCAVFHVLCFTSVSFLHFFRTCGLLVGTLVHFFVLFGELVVVEVMWLLCVSAAVGAVRLCWRMLCWWSTCGVPVTFCSHCFGVYTFTWQMYMYLFSDLYDVLLIETSMAECTLTLMMFSQCVQCLTVKEDANEWLTVFFPQVQTPDIHNLSVFGY